MVIGVIRITPLDAGVELYFPPLRAAGSALMLALFGIACSVIGLAAIAGLVLSGDAAVSLLALAFAGVFALPLFALGQLFIAVALWTAANSLRVEVSADGLRIVRHWFGYPIVRHAVALEDLSAVESRLDAKYLGAFGPARYFRLFARSRLSTRRIVIADTLQGPDMTEEVRQLIIEHLGVPGLAGAGTQAHIAQEEDSEKT